MPNDFILVAEVVGIYAGAGFGVCLFSWALMNLITRKTAKQSVTATYTKAA